MLGLTQHETRDEVVGCLPQRSRGALGAWAAIPWQARSDD